MEGSSNGEGCSPSSRFFKPAGDASSRVNGGLGSGVGGKKGTGEGLPFRLVVLQSLSTLRTR